MISNWETTFAHEVSYKMGFFLMYSTVCGVHWFLYFHHCKAAVCCLCCILWMSSILGESNTVIKIPQLMSKGELQHSIIILLPSTRTLVSYKCYCNRCIVGLNSFKCHTLSQVCQPPPHVTLLFVPVALPEAQVVQ